jgi:hypothetical protein
LRNDSLDPIIPEGANLGPEAHKEFFVLTSGKHEELTRARGTAHQAAAAVTPPQFCDDLDEGWILETLKHPSLFAQTG